MITDPHVSLLDLALSLSNAADLVSPAVVDHHKRVAYISLRLGMEIGLPPEDMSELVIAGALHDMGALSLKERIDALNFELEDPHGHAEIGYCLLNLFNPLSKIAGYIRFHHLNWNYGEGTWRRDNKVPFESHIIHLADRVSVLIDPGRDILGQVGDICSTVEQQTNKMFNPDLVDALKSLSGKDSFWLDCSSDSVGKTVKDLIIFKSVELTSDGILELANVFSVIVDFRSRYTANHSSGVAACAGRLAGLTGFSEHDSKMIRAAGYLHDLGKLAIPAEILSKPSKLTKEEYDTIKNHPYYTYKILEPLNGFEVMNSWAAFHHERMDGSGYPFQLTADQLPLDSRIMAVADIFTALTEDRPYRIGMDKARTLKIIRQMVDNKAIDPELVSLLELNFEDINSCRLAAQNITREEYNLMKQFVNL